MAEHAVGTLTLTLTLTQTLTLTLTLTRWPRTRAPRMRTTEARLPHRTSEPRPEDGPGAHVKARMMYGHPTDYPSTVTRHEDGWLRRRRSPGALRHDLVRATVHGSGHAVSCAVHYPI